MFRTTAVRAVPKAFSSYASPVTRTALTQIAQRSAYRTAARPNVLAVALRPTVQKSLVRHKHFVYDAAKNKAAEDKLMQTKLEPHPDLVSESSSIHPAVQGEVGYEEPEKDVDMMAGIRSDFKTIVDTFSMTAVPKQAFWVGMAGVVPYLATSLSTVALSFDIQYAAYHGNGILFDGNTSEQILHIIEPIQLGYGATIISFLGAIHWGLEFAGYGGHQGYPRYAIGVLATAVAWPTLLLSAEIGLITQFCAFTFLYYTDSRAARAGWAPRWYGIYRFVLTAIVGVSIVASLIGRGQIADLISKPDGPAARLKALREKQMSEIGDEEIEEKEDDDEEDDE